MVGTNEKDNNNTKGLFAAVKNNVKTLGKRQSSLNLLEGTNGLKIHETEPNKYDNGRELRRLLSCIRNGEYHVRTPRELTTFELKELEDLAEAGRGCDVINYMIEIARINRDCLNETSIHILAVYASAELNKMSTNSRQKLRIRVYEALTDLCVTPGDLCKFASLCDTVGSKKGVDMMHRKALQYWYTSKDPWVLAKLMSLCPDANHRNFVKTLNLRKTGYGHVDFQNLLATLSQTQCGQTATSDDNKKKTTKEKKSAIAEYIIAAERIKYAKTAEEAMELITEYQLELDHIPTSLRSFRDVWRTLLPEMSLITLLKNITTFATLKLLSLDPVSYMTLSERNYYTNKYNCDNYRSSINSYQYSSTHPASVTQSKEAAEAQETIDMVLVKLESDVIPNQGGVELVFTLLISLAQYAEGRTGRYYSSTNGFWASNPKICEGLEKTYRRGLTTIVPTGQRYLVLIDCSPSMDCNRLAAFQLSSRAFLGVLLQFLLDSEDSVEVYSGLHHLSAKFPYVKGWKADGISSHSSKVGFNVLDVTQFITWAMKERQVADVFLVISDDGVEYKGAAPHQLLQQYRVAMALPHAKLITLQLCKPTRKIAVKEDLGTLDCHGWDYSTIEVLRSFIQELI